MNDTLTTAEVAKELAPPPPEFKEPSVEMALLRFIEFKFNEALNDIAKYPNGRLHELLNVAFAMSDLSGFQDHYVWSKACGWEMTRAKAETEELK